MERASRGKERDRDGLASLVERGLVRLLDRAAAVCLQLGHSVEESQLFLFVQCFGTQRAVFARGIVMREAAGRTGGGGGGGF